jgi:integrase
LSRISGKGKESQAMKRFRTSYPGVYYRHVRRIGKLSRKGAERKDEGYTERCYYITFKKNGRKIEEKVGLQFRDRMTPAKAAMIRGERIENKRPSLKDLRKERDRNIWTIEGLFDAWKQRPELKGMKPEACRFDLHIKPLLGKKLPQEIGPLDMDRISFTMQKKGLAPQSIKNTLRLLGRICAWGADRGYCKPLAFKINPPKVYNLKTEDLTPDQLQALAKAIDADLHPQAGNLIKLALLTGMRRGEMFRLRWNDIDFERGFITLVEPKGGRDVTIPLNTEASALLQSIPREKYTPYVFPGRFGQQRRDIHKHTRRILDAAGLPKDFRPLHGMRHTFASTLASSGRVELYTIQKLLGHKDAATTQRYAHLRDEALKEASDVGGAMIAEAMKPKNAKRVFSLSSRNKKS